MQSDYVLVLTVMRVKNVVLHVKNVTKFFLMFAEVE